MMGASFENESLQPFGWGEITCVIGSVVVEC